MRCHAAVVVLVAVVASAATPVDFSGAEALEQTRRLVALGPRPPGSTAHRAAQRAILGRLREMRVAVSEDPFTARLPSGAIAMNNIIARFPGSSGRVIVISGHYDTKVMPGILFTGANDGGSSAGFLLEMARALKNRSRLDDVWLVWFDGEEAIGEWSAVDGLHGSRHLAARWSADGTLRRIKALINVDMIGDRALGIMKETGSEAALQRLVWQTAVELGYGAYFLQQGWQVDDDHAPFARAGVRAIDLIDFDYGPGNSFWHTAGDTMDKLSARSFDVVGRVLLEVIRRLEAVDGRR